MRDDDATPTHITNSAHNGNLTAVNVNLKALLEVAYDLPDLRMYGGPAWASTNRFSVSAKSDSALSDRLAGLPAAQAKQIKRDMLQALLADRFRLKVHMESRQLPVYLLVSAKGGAKLETATAKSTLPFGGDRISIQPGSDSLQVLTYELSWRLGRPVLDRTGLTYRGALRLSFADDAASASDQTLPSVFTAVEDQLGLKLEPSRGPVPVLVIDHAEQPTEN